MKGVLNNVSKRGNKGMNEKFRRMDDSPLKCFPSESGIPLIDEGRKPTSTRVIAITSGKGGVGKTNIATNLAIALASLEERVCVFDADLGLANINILLGLSPEFDLQHVVFGNKEISDIMIDAPGDITIIPAGSGVEKLTELNEQQKEKLISSFYVLDKITDFLLVDTSAGISSNVLSFVIAAHETIVVLSPEPTSLTDGYALIKVITSRGYKKPIGIIINMVTSSRIAQNLFQRFDSVVKGKLGARLNYLGHILRDKELSKAVSQQKPVYLFNPKSNASRCFSALAKNISNRSHDNLAEDDIRHFWKRALNFIKSPIIGQSKNREDIIYSTADRFERFKKEFKIELQNTKYSEEHMLQIVRILSEMYEKKFNKAIPVTDKNTGMLSHGKLLDKLRDIQIEERNITDTLAKLKEEKIEYTKKLLKFIKPSENSKSEAPKQGSNDRT